VEIDINLYKNFKGTWKSNKHKIFQIPYKFLNSLEKIEFLGVDVYVPCCVEEYLEFQYGKDWRTPIKDFYSPYRQKIELPIINILKYIIGKKFATKVAKKTSSFVKFLRDK
jgi:hypothetical protein